MRIITVTTEYDQHQDRLQLSVVDKAGHARMLWLTRRLAVRLVPALIQGLSMQSEADVQPEAVQAAQIYAQLQARLNKKPAEPVRPGDGTWVGLVKEISVNTVANGGRLLVFKCQGSDAAELVMNQTDLRLWLQLLQRLFRQADWREDFWPDWMQLPGA